MNVQMKANPASSLVGEGSQVSLSPQDIICVSRNTNYVVLLSVIYRAECKVASLE